MATRLTKDFFRRRDTIEVARDLLGLRLVHQRPDGRRLAGRIVETEAYLGIHDPAAHSFGGRRTPRTEPMFGEAGLSYVYFIYGVYFCFNVVTAEVGQPEAVLVRAVEPLDDLLTSPLKTNGPGKLCIALEIGRGQNALDLTSNPNLWLEEDSHLRDFSIIDGPRVGIGQDHDAVHWPLRFGIQNHPHLSPPRFP